MKHLKKLICFDGEIMKIEKITVSEAKRRIKSGALAFDTGFHIMHISWFTPQTGFSDMNSGLNLEEQFDDCDFVMTTMALRWRDANSIVAVILKEDVVSPDVDIKKWTDGFYQERFSNIF